MVAAPLCRCAGRRMVFISGVFALSTELQFTFDGRNLAAPWIIEHRPWNEDRSHVRSTPLPPEGRFSVQAATVYPEHQRRHRGPQECFAVPGLAADLSGLQILRRARSAYVQAAPTSLHRLVRDRRRPETTTTLQTFDPSVEGLQARAPDLLIVSSFYYDRFADDPTSPDGRFFARLFAGETSYRQVAEFHYEGSCLGSIRKSNSSTRPCASTSDPTTRAPTGPVEQLSTRRRGAWRDGSERRP